MSDEVPVKVGETYDVEIKSVGEKGDGIARVNGFVLFVPGVKKRDYVKIKITKVLPKVGFAQVVERLEKPKRPKKFMQISAEELAAQEDIIPEPSPNDSEDFGDDLEDNY